MPLYEYECKACGARFERRQSIKDDAVKICPECGGEVRRVIRPAGIIFKGKGFYVTDNQKGRSSTVGRGRGVCASGLQKRC
jgi:putative FmdB family regulatory protein